MYFFFLAVLDVEMGEEERPETRQSQKSEPRTRTTVSIGLDVEMVEGGAKGGAINGAKTISRKRKWSESAQNGESQILVIKRAKTIDEGIFLHTASQNSTPGVSQPLLNSEDGKANEAVGGLTGKPEATGTEPTGPEPTGPEATATTSTHTEPAFSASNLKHDPPATLEGDYERLCDFYPQCNKDVIWKTLNNMKDSPARVYKVAKKLEQQFKFLQ